MAYTTINKSTDNFKAFAFTGSGSAGTKTGVGFTPDMFIHKNRDNNQGWGIIDVIRGNGNYLGIHTTNAQLSDVGNYGIATDGYTFPNGDSFFNSGNMIYWNWKAGTTSGISTDSYSTITPTSYSFNATNGFSIVKYNGNETAGAGVPHGLGVAPKMVIVKRLSPSGTGWYVYHKDIGAGNMIALNSTSASSANSTVWNGYNTDATNFYLGTNTGVNRNGDSHIAYCFAEKTGYSKFGSYTGNGNADGAFIYTGFKPAFLLVKTYTTNGGWQLYDNKRNIGNPTAKFLVPSSSNAEASGSNDIDFLSNGFKTRTTNNPGTTDSFIYMAFGQSLVGSNNVPCTAR